jgi:protein-disulfide isomerase/uncharacterized membrane protein
MKQERTLFKALTAVFALAAAVSAYLVYDHYLILNGEDFKSICSVNSYFDCDAVNASQYAVFLGVPVATWGLGYYLGAAVVSVTAAASAYAVREAALLLIPGAAVSLLASVVLFLLSVTRIKAVCLFCSGLYILNIISAGLLLAVSKAWIKKFIPEFRKADRSRLTLFAFLIAATITFTAFSTSQMQRRFPFDAAAFEARFTAAPMASIDTAGAPKMGAENPVIKLVEFSDFECPFCGRQARELKRILRNYQDTVQLTFFNYPLDNSCNPDMQGRPLHRTACMAARAAWCAHQKGRFEAMAAKMFSNQKAISPENLPLWAAEAGLDGATFVPCVDSNEARDGVMVDIRRAQTLHIQGTPTFFINGRRFEGMVTTEVIDWLLAHREKL